MVLEVEVDTFEYSFGMSVQVYFDPDCDYDLTMKGWIVVRHYPYQLHCHEWIQPNLDLKIFSLEH